MSSRLRTAAVALTLATIWVSPILEELVRPSHDQLFHWSGSPFALFGPALMVLIIVAGVVAALLISAERDGYWRLLVWTGVVLFLPWLIVHRIRTIWPDYMPAWVHVPAPLVLAALCPLIAYLAYRYARRQSETVIDSVSAFLAFTALATVMFIVQILWVWWAARDINEPRPVQAASTSARMPSGPRIIWIVLDELSYQQVYEHRYPGLQLPSFDALAADATVFTQVTAASDRTEKALPALLSGHPVQQVAATRSGALLVRSSAKGPWDRFDEWDSVFADASRAGYKTGVGGWYNPYCRMFQDVLDRCYWAYLNGVNTFSGSFVSVLDRAASAPTLRRILNRSLHVPEDFGESPDGGHLNSYLKLNRISDDLLGDRSMSFTFLHLPIPHPYGIYNRQTGKLLPQGGTYIDNLALADRWLGQTRALLESTGQWDSSTVIVMGDHGWRTQKYWEKDPNWTAEEQRASLGGQFDPRPGYIVKLAGQQKGARIDEPFDAIRTRALLDELMSGKIRSPEDLKNWVDHGQGANQKYASDVHP